MWFVANAQKPPPGWLIDGIGRVRDGLSQLRQAVVPANLTVFEMVQGAWLTQAMYAASKLGIFDILAAGPATPEDVAGRVGSDPGATFRLMRALASNSLLKQESGGRFALTRLGDLTPPAIAAMAARFRPAGHWFNIVVTNIPGPQAPLSLLGRRLLACHPVIPLSTVTTVSVALLSYDGSIDVGLLGCGERARDLPTLARAIPAALDELARLAKRAAAAPAAP